MSSLNQRSSSPDIVYIRLGDGGSSSGNSPVFDVPQFLLKARAPDFYEVLQAEGEGTSPEGTTDGTLIQSEYTLPEPVANADLFGAYLKFLCTGETPDELIREKPLEMLKLSNKYGCWQLKVSAELELVKYHLVKEAPESTMDLLLLADAMSCALLKEACVKVLVSNVVSLKELNSLKQWKEIQSMYLIKDFVLAMLERSNSSPFKFTRLAVLALYEHLNREKKAIDGTEPVLKARRTTVMEGCGCGCADELKHTLPEGYR